MQISTRLPPPQPPRHPCDEPQPPPHPCDDGCDQGVVEDQDATKMGAYIYTQDATKELKAEQVEATVGPEEISLKVSEGQDPPASGEAEIPPSSGEEPALAASVEDSFDKQERERVTFRLQCASLALRSIIFILLCILVSFAESGVTGSVDFKPYTMANGFQNEFLKEFDESKKVYVLFKDPMYSLNLGSGEVKLADRKEIVAKGEGKPEILDLFRTPESFKGWLDCLKMEGWGSKDEAGMRTSYRRRSILFALFERWINDDRIGFPGQPGDYLFSGGMGGWSGMWREYTDNVWDDTATLQEPESGWCMQCAPCKCFCEWECKADPTTSRETGSGITTGGTSAATVDCDIDSPTFVGEEKQHLCANEGGCQQCFSQAGTDWRVAPFWNIQYTPPPDLYGNAFDSSLSLKNLSPEERSMEDTCIMPFIDSSLKSKAKGLKELGYIDSVPSDVAAGECEREGDYGDGKAFGGLDGMQMNSGGRACFTNLNRPGLPEEFRKSIMVAAVSFVFVVIHKGSHAVTEHKGHESASTLLRKRLWKVPYYILVAGPATIADVILPLTVIAPISQAKTFSEDSLGTFITMVDYGYLVNIWVMIALIGMTTQDILVVVPETRLGPKCRNALLMICLFPVWWIVLAWTSLSVVQWSWPLLQLTLVLEFDFSWSLSCAVDVTQVVGFVLFLIDALTVTSKTVSRWQLLNKIFTRCTRKKGSIRKDFCRKLIRKLIRNTAE